MDSVMIARRLGAGGLIAVAAVHVNWARGSVWPASDAQRLAQAVIGRNRMPGAVPCLSVSALLMLGASFVSGFPQHLPKLQRAGALGVVVTLALRGVIGASGRMPHDRASQTFAYWNRRLYSPLCIALAALCAAGLVLPGDVVRARASA